MKVANSVRMLVVATALLIAMPASAAEPAASAPVSPGSPSKAMREKMAYLHEQMAACLRSDKALAECRSEMMSACRDTVGAQGCP